MINEYQAIGGMRIGRGNSSATLSTTKYVTRTGIEPGPPLWESGDLPPEVRNGSQTEYAGLVVALWVYIPELPLSNLDRDTSYPD
jgi:hypothetical protein